MAPTSCGHKRFSRDVAHVLRLARVDLDRTISLSALFQPMSASIMRIGLIPALSTDPKSLANDALTLSKSG